MCVSRVVPIIAVLTAAGAWAAPATAQTANESSCTGVAASTGAQVLQPFGSTVVSPTATGFAGSDANFGQAVIAPEATAPREDCP